MGAHRARATFVGGAFLVAMVASIAGGALIESALGPDAVRLSGDAASGLSLGVALELINVLAVVAIAVGLYPLVRSMWEGVAQGYVALRVLEAAFLALAALLPLAAAALARGDGNAAGPPSGVAPLLAVRTEILGVMIPGLFAVGAVLLYLWIWTAHALPRFIAAWGAIGVAAIVLANLVDAGTTVTMALALPIITNEIFLGVWLIVRGFGVRSGIPRVPAGGTA